MYPFSKSPLMTGNLRQRPDWRLTAGYGGRHAVTCMARCPGRIWPSSTLRIYRQGLHVEVNVGRRGSDAGSIDGLGVGGSRAVHVREAVLSNEEVSSPTGKVDRCSFGGLYEGIGLLWWQS
jgi:hypothetical protein